MAGVGGQPSPAPAPPDGAWLREKGRLLAEQAALVHEPGLLQEQIALLRQQVGLLPQPGPVRGSGGRGGLPSHSRHAPVFGWIFERAIARTQVARSPAAPRASRSPGRAHRVGGRDLRDPRRGPGPGRIRRRPAPRSATASPWRGSCRELQTWPACSTGSTGIWGGRRGCPPGREGALQVGAISFREENARCARDDLFSLRTPGSEPDLSCSAQRCSGHLVSARGGAEGFDAGPPPKSPESPRGARFLHTPETNNRGGGPPRQEEGVGPAPLL